MSSRDVVSRREPASSTGAPSFELGGIDEGAIALPSTALSFAQRTRGSAALPVLVVIGVVTLAGATKNPSFLDGATWVNILRTASFTSIVACFEGFVMISGGLDLSVGSTFLAGAMTSAAVVNAGQSDIIAFLATAGVGLGIGALNGFLADFVGISPIIATLGTMFGVSAVVTTLSGGLSIGPLPNRFGIIGQGSWGPVPAVVFYALGVALFAHVLLEYTTYGPKVRAIGGNRSATNNLGINVKRLSGSVYCITGVFAAISGLLQAANLGAGDPSFGSDLELQVIAAVVIGGVSVYGAIGTVPGMVSGCVLLSLITVAIALLHFSGTMQDFAVGLVMVIAVSVDRLRRSRMFRTSFRRSVNGAQ
jgi:ribose transport system permease protein